MKHFEDIVEDQFDFHAYCLRKVTLRAYVSVLRFEDEVYGHSYFTRAAAGIAAIYLHLLDHPVGQDEEEPDYSQMSAAERKKAKAIARKNKKKAEKKAEESPAENAKKNGKASYVDEDPNGEELLKKDPLEELRKMAAMLARYAPQNVETWTIGYDVAMRRSKVLMALQALCKAHALDPESGPVFSRLVDFGSRTFPSEHPAVATVLQEETARLLQGKSVSDFVRDAAQTNCTNLPLRVAIAKALPNPAEATAFLVQGGLNCRDVTVESVHEATAALASLGTVPKEWSDAVAEQFPLLLPTSSN